MSVSEEIINVLDALAERFGMVIDWTAQNVIPYIEQLLVKLINYEIVTSVIWLIFGIIFLFIGKWGIKKTQECYKKYKKDEWSDWCVAAVFVGIGTGVVFLFSIIIIMFQVFDIATCLTLPEKIIFDELKSLMTTSIN